MAEGVVKITQVDFVLLAEGRFNPTGYAQAVAGEDHTELFEEFVELHVFECFSRTEL